MFPGKCLIITVGHFFNQNPFKFIKTVGSNSRKPRAVKITINGSTTFKHFSYGSWAYPKMPIKTPDVGVSILVKPSPS